MSQRDHLGLTSDSVLCTVVLWEAKWKHMLFLDAPKLRTRANISGMKPTVHFSDIWRQSFASDVISKQYLVSPGNVISIPRHDCIKQFRPTLTLSVSWSCVWLHSLDTSPDETISFDGVFFLFFFFLAWQQLCQSKSSLKGLDMVWCPFSLWGATACVSGLPV